MSICLRKCLFHLIFKRYFGWVYNIWLTILSHNHLHLLVFEIFQPGVFFFLAVLVFCVAINKYLRLGDLQTKEVYFGLQFWFTSMVLGSASGKGFRELTIMVEGEGRASVSHGEKGSKRKRRTFQALLNSQILCELV